MILCEHHAQTSISVLFGVHACVSPPDGATLLVVDLDELPEATGIVVVGRLSIPKGLKIK